MATDLPFVEILWDDAISSDDWDDLEDIPRVRRMRSRGWIVGEDARGITLAATLDEEHKPPRFTNEIAIPFGCIVEMRALTCNG